MEYSFNRGARLVRVRRIFSKIAYLPVSKQIRKDRSTSDFAVAYSTGYDLSGKTIIPFNTNAGYGTGSSFDTVKELCKNSTVLEALQ